MTARISTQTIRRQGIRLVADGFLSAGFAVEVASPDLLADLAIRSGSRSHLVKVLAAAAPHHRGGRGSLGLHWMLPLTAADLVALVDLSRAAFWVLPLETFRAKAEGAPGNRYHLDWIVVPLGRPSIHVAMEDEFEAFKLDAGHHAL